ncbi:hypothetical protein CPB85DRAFT_1286946 [Mucidula mucida]|nr:hypothetical protein CPB85DRAFT_1286946 [Mucidula mucida]
MSSTEFTEEEQSRYDRQIRLWGIEAQQSRAASGTATEVIKNIVLAGIGKLVMVDDGDVAEEDLGQDVGQKVILIRAAQSTRKFDGFSSVIARDGSKGESGEP